MTETNPLFFIFAEMLVRSLLIGLGSALLFVVCAVLWALLGPRHEQGED